MLPANRPTSPATLPAPASNIIALNTFDRRQYNVLAPQSLEAISPFHRVNTYAVQLSAAASDGDVFKTGRVQAGEQWVDAFALSKVGLLKLSDAAGVRWDPRQCCRLDNGANPLYVAWQAVGGIRRSDGSWSWVKGTKEIDLEVLREDIREEQARKLDRDRDTPKDPEARAAYLEAKVNKEWLQRRKHKVALAETGAMNRVLRSLLKVKSQYTAADLAKPFIVQQVVLDPTADPAVAQAMKVRVAQDLYDLGFEDRSPEPAAIHSAERTLALVEGHEDSEEISAEEAQGPADAQEAEDDEADLPFDDTDLPEPTETEDPNSALAQEAKRKELLEGLREIAAKSRGGWKGLERWWGTHYPDTPELADVATLEAAYRDLTEKR